MVVTAKLHYLRIAPRKVRLITDLIRGKTVEEARNILNFTTKKGVIPLLKLLQTAIANAKNNFQLEEGNLYIKKIAVDEGPKLKRWRARARGVAYEIQKKTSHITLILDVTKAKAKKVKKVKKAEEVKEAEKVEKVEKPPKESPRLPTGQAKLRPETEIAKPKVEKEKRRMFRRMAF